MDESPRPVCYEIRVRGLAGGDGTGIVRTGPLPDQAALPGVLAQMEALGYELLELRRTRCTGV